MNRPIFILFLFLNLLITSTVEAQTIIKLRDVTFKAPGKFKLLIKENAPIKYDAFYENGKIYLDSTNINSLPTIAYQYYENPDAGSEHSEKVLKDLNDIMTKDFKPDSLKINGDKDFSWAKYSINGNTLFEIKSLGEKGWINIAFVDKPQNDNENYKAIVQIINSIKHTGEYGGEYKRRKEESGNSSKIVILGLVVLGFGYFIRKLQKNNVA